LKEYLLTKNRKAIYFTIFAAVLWGTSFPAIRIGLRYVDTLLFVFLRFLVAFIVTLMMLLVTRNIKFKANENKKLLIFLGLSNGVAYLLQYLGMNYTSAAKASLFVNLTAVWVSLFSPKLVNEHFGRKKAVGVISGLLGLFLVTTNLNFEILSREQLIGDVLVISAGIIWSLFIIYNKKMVMDDKDVLQEIILILLITLLPMLPFVVFSVNKLFFIPIEGWLSIGYTAIFCWVIPYYLWLEGLKHISASNSTILLLTEILVATTIGILVLDEILTFVMAIGGFLIFIAVVLASRNSN
jgi:drug/metabolite transporter (DMT)-like permease